MGKYKFEEEDNANAAHEEIIQSGYQGVSEVNGLNLHTKTDGLTSDLILEIEKIIKKHGGKAVFVSSLA